MVKSASSLWDCPIKSSFTFTNRPESRGARTRWRRRERRQLKGTFLCNRGSNEKKRPRGDRERETEKGRNSMPPPPPQPPPLTPHNSHYSAAS
ncbi:hypothetical protein E2C01_086867 [Portunus trituberculatus]|uniref:Uncharacterized protein n=1 Tax=Portunus trituberculatus TaxID=210409 RepID=A0A5B7JEL5_PORTR|nr:hypothetical protein [Portunus trituberculatus]